MTAHSSISCQYVPKIGAEHPYNIYKAIDLRYKTFVKTIKKQKKMGRKKHVTHGNKIQEVILLFGANRKSSIVRIKHKISLSFVHNYIAHIKNETRTRIRHHNFYVQRVT